MANDGRDLSQQYRDREARNNMADLARLQQGGGSGGGGFTRGNNPKAARGDMLEALLSAGFASPALAQMLLYGPMSGLTDAADSTDTKNTAILGDMSHARQMQGLELTAAKSKLHDALGGNSSGGSRGASSGLKFNGSGGNRPGGSWIEQEGRKDFLANRESARQNRAASSRMQLLQSILGNNFGNQTETRTEEALFNRAGAPEAVPLRSTVTRSASPSELASLMQLLFSGGM